MTTPTVINRHGNIDPSEPALVGYKGRSTGDIIDYENHLLHRNFYVVDDEGPTLTATIEWVDHNTLLHPEFVVVTDQGVTIFYQEPGLYFGEDGMFYYTLSTDTGYYYCPYLPLMNFKSQV